MIIPKEEPTVSPVNTSVQPVLGDVTSYAPQDITPAPISLPVSQPCCEQPSDAPDDIMARTRRLPSIQFSSSALFGSSQVRYVANNLFNSLSNIVNTTNFKFFRYDAVSVKFTPVVSKYFRGLIGVTFVPLTTLTVNSPYATPTSLSSLPTTYIDCSSCCTVEMSFPWIFPYSKLAPADLGKAGMLVFWTVDPVACDTAPGVTSTITLQMEARFIKPRLLDPCNAGSTVPSAITDISLSPSPGTFAYCQGPKTVQKEAEEKASKGTISSTLDSVSSIASYASSFPVVGGFASGLAVVTKAASSVFDWFGLSKPQNISTPHFVIGGVPPFTSTFDGVTNGDVLSSEQLPYVSTDPHLLCATSDLCNMVDIMTRPTLIGRFPTQNFSGTPILLGTVPVMPLYGWRNGKNYSPSNVGYVSSFFKNWRGELAYKFIIPATVMSRTRLAISYSLNRESSFNENGRFMYVDVSGTTIIDGVIPWTQREIYQRLDFGRNDVTNDPAANGFIQIWQINELVSDTPGETPYPLNVIVFSSGTVNTQFAGTTHLEARYAALDTDLIPPAGFLGLDNSLTVSRILSEDKFMNVREFLHAPYNASSYTVPQGTLTSNITITNGWLDFRSFIARHRWWRGSLTLKIWFPVDIPPGLIQVWTIDGPNRPSSWLLWDPRETRALELTVPMSISSGFYDSANVYIDLPLIRMEFASTTTQAYPYRVAPHMNDDFSVGMPIGSCAFTNH